jgi:hypothetical protein
MNQIKMPLINISAGTIAALGTFSDSLAQVPSDVVKTISQAPDNWDDLQKGLIAMGVSILSQFILSVSPKILKSISNLFKKSKENDNSIKNQKPESGN